MNINLGQFSERLLLIPIISNELKITLQDI